MVPNTEGITVICACVIQCPAEKLYAFWRQLENLPQVMHHLISVKQTSPTESHWVAKGPAKRNIEWDAEIVDEAPNRLIAWRAKAGSGLAHSGSIRFEPAVAAHGTDVTVSLEYDPSDGKAGSAVSAVFGEEPGAQIADELRRLKAMMETGRSSDPHSAFGRQTPLRSTGV